MECHICRRTGCLDHPFSKDECLDCKIGYLTCEFNEGKLDSYWIQYLNTIEKWYDKKISELRKLAEK